MKGVIGLIAGLYLVATGVGFPGVARAIDERVIKFRSLEVAPVVPPEVCERGALFLGIQDRDLPADTMLFMFDADLFSSRVRTKDGLVVEPEARTIGRGLACAWLSFSAFFGNLLAEPPFPIDQTQPLATSPFYGEFEVGGVFLAGGGECSLTSNTLPVPGLGLVACNLRINPDPDQGLLGGNATSNSVFNPLGLPGFQTGSFWTVHIYEEPGIDCDDEDDDDCGDDDDDD